MFLLSRLVVFYVSQTFSDQLQCFTPQLLFTCVKRKWHLDRRCSFTLCNRIITLHTTEANLLKGVSMEILWVFKVDFCSKHAFVANYVEYFSKQWSLL